MKKFWVLKLYSLMITGKWSILKCKNVSVFRCCWMTAPNNSLPMMRNDRKYSSDSTILTDSTTAQGILFLNSMLFLFFTVFLAICNELECKYAASFQNSNTFREMLNSMSPKYILIVSSDMWQIRKNISLISTERILRLQLHYIHLNLYVWCCATAHAFVNFTITIAQNNFKKLLNLLTI